MKHVIATSQMLSTSLTWFNLGAQWMCLKDRIMSGNCCNQDNRRLLRD